MVRFWLFVNKISDNAVKAFHNHFEKYVERDIHSDIAFSGDFKLAFLRTGFLLGKRYKTTQLITSFRFLQEFMLIYQCIMFCYFPRHSP